jgi:hypothetical protein
MPPISWSPSLFFLASPRWERNDVVFSSGLEWASVPLQPCPTWAKTWPADSPRLARGQSAVDFSAAELFCTGSEIWHLSHRRIVRGSMADNPLFYFLSLDFSEQILDFENFHYYGQSADHRWIVRCWHFSPLWALHRICLLTINLPTDSPRLQFLHRQLAKSLSVDFQYIPNWHCTFSNWPTSLSINILTWIPTQPTWSHHSHCDSIAYGQNLNIANLINQSNNKKAIYRQEGKTSMNKDMNFK